MHNNLYLVSEPLKVSLFEYMPYLLDCSRKNQFMGVLVAHELINILYDVVCLLEN